MSAVASRRVFPAGDPAAQTAQLVSEHTITVTINDVPSFEIVCSPTGLEDLVLGRLLTEGVIHTLDEVDVLYICQDGFRANVLLAGGKPVARPSAAPEKIPTCCTGNRTLADLFGASERPAQIVPLAYRQEWIFTLARELTQDMPIYEATHGVHSALLMHRGEVLTRAEDIGRHNALDKVIGWALRHEVPLGECIVYSSGRIPVDMVRKVIRAGVPVFVSKAMPTRQALELAREFGLTLIAAARPDSMVLLAGAQED
ncbi:MAG: formate dehydrogenase accessory sulfurtransferase FdhD [Oscillospiraceae bacterium]|nr:formate dehydrogenase accessory sulfurtransferase FdhD [Oscillospiraceae bacterium]